MGLTIEYLQAFFLIVILLISLYYLKSRRWKISSLAATNWPLLGMVTGLVHNVYSVCIHDTITDVLIKTHGTFKFKGPLFSGMNMLVTCDPSNIHHIFSKNFSNYPKGSEFRETFDILGDGIFNADYKLWEIHRKTTMALMNSAMFYHLLEQTMWKKVEKGLLPFLEYFCNQEVEFDLQDMFQRLTFDSICTFLMNHDPRSLSIDLPYIPCEKAINDVLEMLMYRYLLPVWIRKLQKWLQIGNERNLTEACRAIDEFIYPCILLKQGDDSTSFIKAFNEISVNYADSKKFLRDTVFNLILAGRDTTGTTLAWLFWLLTKNPLVEGKILNELETKLNLESENKKWRSFSVEESRKLVYLHGALCETLRLYPPVALEHKASTDSDVLPSGHCIDPNTKVVISFYSMGRMETIWGNDCLKFKPERWITERGEIKHEPSFKFTAFNVGPRACIGKEMGFIQMKIIAASIIYNYHVQVVEAHPVLPSSSVILKMKHGLKVMLRRRNV